MKLIFYMARGVKMADIHNENNDQMELFEAEILDVEEEGNKLDYLSEEERHVNIEKATYSVFEIYRRYKRGDIIVKPFYQRNPVWPNSKKSKLIESVIRNIPIPSFYFAELDDGKWEVVDGQQRLRAFFEFISNEYRLSSLPVLTDLNRKYFKDLTSQGRKIEDYILHIFIIKKNSHPDIRFDIFERINEGATQLNAQELRNSMYRNGQNEILKKLSKKASFIKLTKGKLSEKRLKNEEAVLRFLSFCVKDYDTDYNGNMNAFLNDTMEKFYEYFNQDTTIWEEHFNETMEVIFQVLGPKAFIRNNGRVINMSLFDVLTYSFSIYNPKVLLKNKDKIKALYDDLTTNNDEFIKSISTNTLAKRTVHCRFEIWLTKMEEIIEEESHD